MDFHIDRKIGALVAGAFLLGGVVGGSVGAVAGHEGHEHRGHGTEYGHFSQNQFQGGMMGGNRNSGVTTQGGRVNMIDRIKGMMNGTDNDGQVDVQVSEVKSGTPTTPAQEQVKTNTATSGATAGN